ncbi:hypothetical protein EDB85DRAFT_2141830 [Lactarius pseudohatsudake]|nr:hypothetical protein EDB85DRAFT_2141830 [Lactarius pseudohatsudake]
MTTPIPLLRAASRDISNHDSHDNPAAAGTPATSTAMRTPATMETFVELSAVFRRDESEVLKCYRNFLTVAPPLLEDSKLTVTEDDLNAEFFKGFHLDDRGILAD